MTDKLRDAADAALSIIDVLRHQQPNSQILRAVSSMLREALAEPQGEPDAAGLLHDRAHVDTGKVRAAQSVRTPEMSYRPGSLPMEDKPVARVTGYYGGRCVIEPLDGKSVFPTGMAIYTRGMRELSDEEIIAVADAMDQFSLMLQDEIVRFARAIIDAARKA